MDSSSSPSLNSGIILCFHDNSSGGGNGLDSLSVPGGVWLLLDWRRFWVLLGVQIVKRDWDYG